MRLSKLLLLTFVLLLDGCRGRPPKLDWQIYAGDSSDGSIKRSQAGQVISCSDPKFDDYLAISYEDFKRSMLKVMSSCKVWYPTSNAMDIEELKKDEVVGTMFFGSGGTH